MSKFSTIIQSHPLVLVDFFAEWCGPCKMLAPILKQLKERLGDDVKIVKIDVDRNQPLAEMYQVQGVPTMMLYKDGLQVWRQSGVVQVDDLERIIKQHK